MGAASSPASQTVWSTRNEKRNKIGRNRLVKFVYTVTFLKHCHGYTVTGCSICSTLAIFATTRDQWRCKPYWVIMTNADTNKGFPTVPRALSTGGRPVLSARGTAGTF